MTRPARRVSVGVVLAALVLLVSAPGASAKSPQPNAAQRLDWRGHIAIQAPRLGTGSWTTRCQKALGISCYIPRQLERAYDLLGLYSQGWDGSGSTIAIVDSFGSPTIQSDLATFDQQFGLPAPPSLQVIQPAGQVPPFDPSNSDMVNWAVETSLDVEWAHALAPGANILLAETPVSETEGVHGFPQMIKAENYIIDHHMADVISQSFAATEETFPSHASIRSLRSAYINARNNGVTVVGATGDAGATDYKLNLKDFYGRRVTAWPSTDPLVTAVGGTQLHLDSAGRRIAPDNVWNDTYNPNVNSEPSPTATGGGLSHVMSRPNFQDGVSSIVGDARGVPDISMSAAVDGGVLTYLGFLGGDSGLYIIGGTSEATPEFAAVVSIADQAAGHSLGFLNPMLYELAARGAPGIVDVTIGDNTVTFTQHGQTQTVKGYKATAGYDLASGLGTVDAANLVMELANFHA